MWKHAKRIRVEDHWLLDGEVARQAIITRQEAERDMRGMLDEFLGLCDAPNEAILHYAQTWGVLELCHHNLPSSHDLFRSDYLLLPTPRITGPAAAQIPTRDPRQCPPTRREPLSTWRFFSRQAQSILRIAADLQGPRPRLGSVDDWERLLRPGVSPVQSLDAQGRCLGDVIEGWLSLGRIKPAIGNLTMKLTWSGADLFGELAVLVALAATAKDGQVFCAACGNAYEPKRRVIRRGFNYCPEDKCQRQADAMRAQRYRDRKKDRSVREGRPLPFRGPYGSRTNDPIFS